MRGIILAAGDGGRLHPLTLHTPKPLLEVGGRPLIRYALDALMSAGISEIMIVVGYLANQLTVALKGIRPPLSFAYNDRYHGENAVSLYSARDFAAGGPFVVCMGDHPVSPSIIQSVTSHPVKGCVLGVDSLARHASQIDDATRVKVDSAGHIVTIGKRLQEWNAVDTGIFRMNGDVFPVIERLMEERGVDVGITDVVRQMGEAGQPFTACDVSGRFWADVDTIEDYRSVDGLLREMAHGKPL